MTSLYVNGSDGADAQLIIDRKSCATGEVRLTLVNHDESESASMFVSADELCSLIDQMGDLD